MELGIEEAGSKKFRMLYMEKEEREKFYKEQEEAAKQKKVAELEKQTKEAYQHFWKLQQEKTAEEIFWKIDSLFYSYQKEAYIKATVQFLKKYVTIQYPVKYILIFRQNRENKISVSSSF